MKEIIKRRKITLRDLCRLGGALVLWTQTGLFEHLHSGLLRPHVF